MRQPCLCERQYVLIVREMLTQHKETSLNNPGRFKCEIHGI